MSHTIDRARTDAAARVDAWLSSFQDALRARDVDRAAGLFATDSYWRDLVSFTWNIITVEGPGGVAGMLRATLEHTDPVDFAVTGEPTEADGVTEAWFSIGTATGRGTGHLRLVDGTAWTLLTTLDELTGHEEPRKANRPKVRWSRPSDPRPDARGWRPTRSRRPPAWPVLAPGSSPSLRTTACP